METVRFDELNLCHEILRGIKGIEFVKFERNDVMRNPIVYKIIQRYENEEKE